MGRQKLDNEVLRLRLLDQIRSGKGRFKSARIVGISETTFAAYYRTHPEFRAEVNAAEDASVEDILGMLRDKALIDGDIQAAKEYLRHVAPAPRAEREAAAKEVHHTFELPAEQIDSIRQLEARLQARGALQPAPEVIEVEEVPPDRSV